MGEFRDNGLITTTFKLNKKDENDKTTAQREIDVTWSEADEMIAGR